ncbi:MAG: hypothetical protein QHH06_01700 [Clostridiales bacterium]|jgi:hypothetical protein|nr:hypothetical protein [Eubacteriales bacterium]MDH7565184.1 hypothetical protein [Clostridiales bacterium]
MKVLTRCLIFLQACVGIGAFFGGMLALSDPSGIKFGMPAAQALKNSPFSSFLIPAYFYSQ